MPKANIRLIDALRTVATRIETGAPYMWGHMGSCNCGHLAQELTAFTKEEIHRYALQRYGDWKQQVMDFCPTTGAPLDMIIGRMMDYGMTADDLMRLEDLSDERVLRKLPGGKRVLQRNKKEDAVSYMRAMAEMLEEELAAAPQPERFQLELA